MFVFTDGFCDQDVSMDAGFGVVVVDCFTGGVSFQAFGVLILPEFAKRSRLDVGSAQLVGHADIIGGGIARIVLYR